MRNRLIASLLAVSALPASAGAQSLASIAQSGRRSSRTQARVFTDADLRAARDRVGFVEVAAEAESPSSLGGIPDLGFGGIDLPATGTEPVVVDERTQRRSDLQRQLDEQVKIMDVVRKAMADAQSELNDLTQLTFGPGRRAQLIKLVEDGQRELARLEQVIAQLDEQARRDGFVLSR
jgi:hypothetical protein